METSQDVTLRCPQCKETITVDLEDTDPPGTAVVECKCPECDTGGGKPFAEYFDADGNQLAPV